MSQLYSNFEKIVTQIESGNTELLSAIDMAFENVVCEGTEEEVSKSIQIMESFLISHLCEIEEDSSSAA